MASLVLLDATPLSGPDNERGIGTYVRGLIGAMSALPAVERPELLLGAGVPSPSAFVSHRVSGSRGRLDGLRGHAMAAITERSDLVHLTAPDLDISAPAQILSCHDLIPLRFPVIELGAGRALARRRYNRYLDRLTWARLVLVPSQATADDLTQLLAIPARRIRVIPYGAPEVGPEQHAADAPGAGRVVLIVANREPHTNAALALRALAHTDPRHGLQLVVAGVDDRRRRGRLERVASSLGVHARTYVLGALPSSQLSALRAAAFAALVPSRIEGCSVPTLAAMAFGLPVVSSAIPAQVEALGSSGLVVSGFAPRAWADALDGLAEDPTRRADLSERSRIRARALSWAEAGARTRAAYAEACGD